MKRTARARFGRSTTAVIVFVFGFVLTQPGPDIATTIAAPSADSRLVVALMLVVVSGIIAIANRRRGARS